MCLVCQAEQAAVDPAAAGGVVKIRGTEGPLMTLQHSSDGVASLVWFWNGRVRRADLPSDLLEPVG